MTLCKTICRIELVFQLFGACWVCAGALNCRSSAWGAAPTASPLETARRVDEMLAIARPKGAVLAPLCDDATYLRRVWIDVVGDLPTPEHIMAFCLDSAPDKRDRVVEQLLADPRYGMNWARYWRDVIFSRRLEDRAMVGANALEADLAQWFNAGDGWDAIAARFLTATGDVRENGATALILAQEGRTEEVAAEASRIFLGMQIQCAQCHDHPTDRWRRNQFHELAAFFPRVGVRPVQTATRRSFAVFAADRPMRFRRNAETRPELEHRMPDLNDPGASGPPIAPRFFLTGASLQIGSRDEERRTKLAEWFVSDRWFAKAVINRFWSELVGEGFYEPVDDLGPDRHGEALETLEELATRFAESGYDLKWLVRALCATEAYQRQSRPRRHPEEAPFLANVAQPLRADQLLNAILSALEMNEPQTRSDANPLRNQGLRFQFFAIFGFDPSDPRESIAASIPQSLALMNSPQLLSALRADASTSLATLCNETQDRRAIAEEIYLRTLSRLPTPSELTTIDAYFSATSSQREAVEDLAWALINSAEFRHRK